MSFFQKNVLPLLIFSFIGIGLLILKQTYISPHVLGISQRKIVKVTTMTTALIPKPVSVNPTNQTFALSKTTTIFLNTKDKELTTLGKYLSQQLQPSIGSSLSISVPQKSKSLKNVPNDDRPLAPNSILLTIDSTKSNLGPEGYTLSITPDYVTLSANTYAGLFRSIQTLRQLAPQIRGQVITGLPTGTIIDYPRYVWRGAMLDVARHFFGVNDVKKYIDELAYYKINVLHLHLTDDQAWRIEIPSRKNLTKSEPFYFTLTQYRDIITYAKSRYMIIIPEVDMPAHSKAARNAYPEIGCGNNICVDTKETNTFITDVINTIAKATPDQYIHIGGDETDMDAADYNKFMQKAQNIVNNNDKTMIGWSEAGDAITAPSLLQYWLDDQKARDAQAKGMQIIMSPGKYAYLDLKYNPYSRGNRIVGYKDFITVQDAYEWDPTTAIPDVSAIKGIESPLWTELIGSFSDVQYMAFPRIIGHAEIGWSPATNRNWWEYRNRLALQGPALRAMGINFYASPEVDWQ